MKRQNSRKYLLIFLGFSAAFLALKLPHVAPRVSDENYYIYATHLVLGGALPYRDFFLAHFPTQILLYAALAKMFGFSIAGFKVLQLLVTVGSAFLLFRIGSRKRNAAVGIVASAPLAGLALFVGLTMRRYILPAALGFVAYELLKRNWRKVMSFLTCSLSPFFLVNIVLFALFGEDFLTSVWRYQLAKFSASLAEDPFGLFLRKDWVLVMLSTGGI